MANQECYTSNTGARAFGDACTDDVIYDDCTENPNRPIVGKEAVLRHLLCKVQQRRNSGGQVRVEQITDGHQACGFAWTWTRGDEEGLRGTTFVQLEGGKIKYVRELCEPIFKPGDSMVGLLKLMSKEQERAPVPYTRQTPTTASAIGRYLFDDVQWADIEECKRFLNEDIFCRDFNYPHHVQGREETGEFAKAIGCLPGIEFHGEKFDDGVLSTCYVWHVNIEGAPDPVKGISFQVLNRETKKIEYMRDASASTVLPPFLGKLARFVRPGLGVFRGVPRGSRPGGK